MKNLANCKPSEFLKQTNRIKRSAEKWLKDTELSEIRKNSPQLEEIPLDAGESEIIAITAENKRRVRERAYQNLSRFLDKALEEHADETLELLALVCFVEPKDADKHSIDEYLTSITEIMNNQAVIGFFTSLMQWGQMNI